VLYVNATNEREPALQRMPDNSLIARAAAAIEEARSLCVDRDAIRDAVEASRATLRESVIESLVATDRSATARLAQPVPRRSRALLAHGPFMRRLSLDHDPGNAVVDVRNSRVSCCVTVNQEGAEG
jgi:hypothetical protein